MLSSLKLQSLTYIGRDEEKKLTLIVTYLIDLPESGEFIHPVDWEELELNDYPIVVKHPMNLLKVQDKLKGREYSTVENVLDDIQLIWDNCKLYNPEGPFYVLADKMERNYKKMIKNYLPNINVIIPKPIGSRQEPAPQPTPAPPPPPPAATKVAHKPPPRVAPPHPTRHHPPPKETHYEEPASLPERHQQPPEPEDIPQSEKNRLQQRMKQLTQQQLATIICIVQDNCPEAFKELGSGRAQLHLDNVDVETFKKMGLKVDELLEGDKGMSKKVKV